MEGGTQVSNIPTPETDASTFDPYTWNQNGLGRSYSPEVMYQIDDGEWVPIDKTRDLERRLSVARGALMKARERIKYTDPKILGMEEIDQALTLTAPKL